MEDAIDNVAALDKKLMNFEQNFKKCSKQNRTEGYLEGRIKGLDELWQKICAADDTLEALKTELNANESYYEDNQFGVFEEKYYQLQGEIKEQLKAFKPQPQVIPNANQNNQNAPPQRKQSKKLPKIELPTFDGSYHNWLSFKNRFTNMIHNDTELSNIDKLEYLKSCVIGDAETAIKRFQITDRNYTAAWNRLNEKYDNKRILQDTQIETIIDRKVIFKESASELRQLIDVMQESLEELKNMQVDTASWDPMLVVLIKRKLAFKTREEWEKAIKPDDVPTYAQLIEFLEHRFRTLESLELVNGPGSDTANKNQTPYSKAKPSQSSQQRAKCLACNNAVHSLMMCDTFLNMTLSNRNAFVNAKRLCRNCLSTGHLLKECKSAKKCFKCQRTHNTLLHRDEFNESESQEPSYSTSNPFNSSQSNSNLNQNRNRGRAFVTNNAQTQQQHSQQSQNYQTPQTTHSQVSQPRRNMTTMAETEQAHVKGSVSEALFPTATIKVKSEGGIIYNLRALLDQCSDEVFIKASVAKMLGGKQNSIPSFDVIGLEDVVTSTVDKSTHIRMIVDENLTLEFDANIVKTLVGMIPKTEIRWPKTLFKNLKLADNNVATPNNVDIMLGTKIYAEILTDGVLKEGGYIAQNTKLGWIISGKGDTTHTTQENTKRTLLCLNTRSNPPEDQILKKFWEIEEEPRRKPKFTKEEKDCIQSFKNTYRRLEDGRPQVKLPFKEKPSKMLGESRNQAVARWLAMERKLEKDPQLKKDYMAAIQEHLDLGHMAKVETTSNDHQIIHEDGSYRYSCYYIPHHAVVREESKTTKTRIVFDASAKTNTGKSLNDILMVGPTIQESIIVRLMKWRKKKYALRGDITKMYRQIKVYPEDIDFQRMVFRFNKKDPIEDYGLNTLTFGTASAPYMAIAALQEVGKDSESEYPVGTEVVKNEFHVDDLLTGGETVEEVKGIWKEVREMLMKAQFPMRKWSSNSNEVLQQIPEDEREFKSAEIKIEDTLKTLGIGWSPIEDYFFFTTPEFNVKAKLSKRNFLSQAASLFDPLGWLGPAVMKPKIMFQKIWKAKLQWDDQISAKLAQEWIEFRDELNALEKVKIPRWLGIFKDCTLEIHGFSDASEQAYGAVIYIKTINQIGNSKVELVLAKSRVAPIQTVRLPRLELCGAVLLANLVDMVKVELEIDKAYCWTDSSITLDWINSEADKYKTFVANRVAEIQEFTVPQQWRHVEGKQNPADCLSRGLSPKELLSHELWWNGPEWLKLPKDKWPKNPNVKIPEDQLELKGKKVLVTQRETVNEVLQGLMEKYSSFKLLLRVAARIRTVKNEVRTKYLSPSELENERMFWIRIVQNSEFKSEIDALSKGEPIHSKSKVVSLNPFLDQAKVLRIGGRLKEAMVDYDSKHPIIIPKNSTLSYMIINDAHRLTKHGGTQLTMTYTRAQYWIIDTRKSVRNQIHKCVKCHRHSNKLQNQLMGSLPDSRVNLRRAFLHTGIDYAGPVEVLTVRKPGKRQTTKGWVAVFVCLCTKAIHLELVSRLTTEAFLASFQRFQGRRGLPSNMYSDNSKTFIGANNEINKDVKIIKETLEPELADILLKDSIQWNFIPPHAPHWGGIWEAGVKSMKHHIKRVIGNSIHTFEEITTMLVEIEAVLNSRPLCPVSEDPNDLSILTPGHFIIGAPLLAAPRPSLLEIQPNRLGIYKQISQRVEHFAKRWKNEYLSTLQHRRKWMRQCENVEIGDLVLIKDDDFPPSKWLMGRVVEVFPDEEGLVRRVMIRTENGKLMRSIHKISILPIDKPLMKNPSK